MGQHMDSEHKPYAVYLSFIKDFYRVMLGLGCLSFSSVWSFAPIPLSGGHGQSGLDKTSCKGFYAPKEAYLGYEGLAEIRTWEYRLYIEWGLCHGSMTQRLKVTWGPSCKRREGLEKPPCFVGICGKMKFSMHLCLPWKV